jgi:hypothetical protein
VGVPEASPHTSAAEWAEDKWDGGGPGSFADRSMTSTVSAAYAAEYVGIDLNYSRDLQLS